VRHFSFPVQTLWQDQHIARASINTFRSFPFPHPLINLQKDHLSLIALSSVTTSNTIKVYFTSGKEDPGSKEPRVSKPKTLGLNHIKGTRSDPLARKTLLRHSREEEWGREAEDGTSSEKPMSAVTRSAGWIWAVWCGNRFWKSRP
jgi:hypothetical protein